MFNRKKRKFLFHELYNEFVELIATGFLENKIKQIQNVIKQFKEKLIGG